MVERWIQHGLSERDLSDWLAVALVKLNPNPEDADDRMMKLCAMLTDVCAPDAPIRLLNDEPA